MKPLNQPTCSNEILRIIEAGVEEIIGRDCLNSLRVAVQPSNSGDSGDIGMVLKALEGRFGPCGGQGVAMRSGRASFRHFSQVEAARKIFSDITYRLQPTAGRITAGLEMLAGFLMDHCGGTISVSQDKNFWYWRMEDYPWCWNEQKEIFVCRYITGVIQELTAWASGGRFYEVEIVDAGISGSVSLMRIHQKPVD